MYTMSSLNGRHVARYTGSLPAYRVRRCRRCEQHYFSQSICLVRIKLIRSLPPANDYGRLADNGLSSVAHLFQYRINNIIIYLAAAEKCSVFSGLS